MDALAVLWLIVFIEGFVSVAVEIITIRQLLPVVGGSVTVTSLIIGVFLLFLALGYRHGGQKVERLPERLLRNFQLAAAWLGIGLSYIFIALFFYYLQKLTGSNSFYPLIAYLLFVLAPLVFILGQTIPITMNMYRQNKLAGVIGGQVLFLSTIGSFLGATFTALILMQYFGVAWTIVINFLLLCFLSFVLLRQVQKAAWLQMIIMAMIFIFVYMLNIQMERQLFERTTAYGNYQIIKPTAYPASDDEKILVINNSYSSYTNQAKKGFSYIEKIKRILFQEWGLRNGNILVLGAGGFTLSAENTYQNHFTYVDIDGQLKDIVVPHFLNEMQHEFISDDARHFVAATTQKYNAIIVDTFSNTNTIPAHLLTQEFIQSVKKILAPHGVVIFNIIANPTLQDNYSKRIDNTIRSVMQSCMVIPKQYINALTNILYICQVQGPTSGRVYTDDLNTSPTDAFNW